MSNGILSSFIKDFVSWKTAVFLFFVFFLSFWSHIGNRVVVGRQTFLRRTKCPGIFQNSSLFPAGSKSILL